jgi:acetyltransferase
MRVSLATAFAPARAAAAPMIRPIRPADASALRRFIRGLSPASRYARFMMGIRELPQSMLERFVNPLPVREAVLMARSPVDGIIGLVQYVADESGDGCEVALVVTDAWQRQGLGTRLLEAVTTIAGEQGIRHFHADVLADNYPMRALARKVGCEVSVDPRAAYMVRISRTIKSRTHKALT